MIEIKNSIASAANVNDTLHCPLCGQANGCCATTATTAAGEFNCWCKDYSFPAQTLTATTAQNANACVCKTCAQQLNSAETSQ